MKVAARYIKDIVYGANDGIITTFAVVAGVAGAALSSDIVLILGFASLIADGFSMAASNYLGSNSEKDYLEGSGGKYEKSVFVSASLTFFSFIFAGVLPLLPYVFGVANEFYVASIATACALFFVGAMRSVILKQRWFVLGVEMLVVGGAAAGAAFLIGRVIKNIIGI